MAQWNIIPIRDNSKEPAIQTLKPYFQKRYEGELTNYTNTAIIMGNTSNNLIVLDIDDKELAQQIKIDLLELTYMVKTASNGLHIYIYLDTYGDTVPRRTKLLKDEKQVGDFMSAGYVIAAGSVVINKEGKSGNYTAVNDVAIKHSDLDNIDKLLRKYGISVGRKTGNKLLREELLNEPCPEGEGNDRCYKAAIAYIDEFNTLEEAYDALIEWNKRVCPDAPIPETELEQTFNSARNGTCPSYLKKKEPKKSDKRKTIVTQLLKERKIYSDAELRLIYENKDGFLINITNTLKKDLAEYDLEENDYKSIMFKLESKAQDIPKTNKDLVVFKNGIRSKKKDDFVQTEDIAAIGFTQFNYIINANPKRFIKMMFGDIDESQHSQLYRGLRSILTPRLDPKITIVQGRSSVGKSTAQTILVRLLGDYALSTTVSDFFEDRATRAKIQDKLLLVFQDMPKDIKHFNLLKSITGESEQSVRGYHSDVITFENKIKIFGSTNNLFDVPEDEKDAFFTQRVSLVSNIRKIPFEQNNELIDDIVEQEGEEIISWLYDLGNNYKYEDKQTVQELWTITQSPELGYIKRNYRLVPNTPNPIHVGVLQGKLEMKLGIVIDNRKFKKQLMSMKYTIKDNMITDMELIDLQEVLQ